MPLSDCLLITKIEFSWLRVVCGGVVLLLWCSIFFWIHRFFQNLKLLYYWKLKYFDCLGLIVLYRMLQHDGSARAEDPAYAVEHVSEYQVCCSSVDHFVLYMRCECEL